MPSRSIGPVNALPSSAPSALTLTTYFAFSSFEQDGAAPVPQGVRVNPLKQLRVVTYPPVFDQEGTSGDGCFSQDTFFSVPFKTGRQRDSFNRSIWSTWVDQWNFLAGFLEERVRNRKQVVEGGQAEA